MKGVRTVGVAVGLVLVVAALVLGLSASFSSPHVSAATGTINVGAATVAVGGQGTVSLQAQNMTAPGLGAWSMNIVYDPAVVQLVAQPQGCQPQSGSVCNPNFAANTIRVTGATANGLIGTTTLATVTFRCISVGTSALTVTVDTLADATPGNPQNITATTTNGSVSCQTPPTPAQPTTAPAPTATPAVSGAVNAGFGPGGSGPSVIIWLVAGLAGAGLAWLSVGLAGAGLAAVTGAEPRRTRTTGFLPRMRPPTRRARGDAQARSVSPDQMPSARALERPERDR